MTLKKKCIRGLLLALVVAALCVIPAFASSAGNVADAVEQTWTDAAGQIKTVVDTVVFPALSLVLAIAFFVKLAMAYFDYRKHGQFDVDGPRHPFCLPDLRAAGPQLHLEHRWRVRR